MILFKYSVLAPNLLNSLNFTVNYSTFKIFINCQIKKKNYPQIFKICLLIEEVTFSVEVLTVQSYFVHF